MTVKFHSGRLTWLLGTAFSGLMIVAAPASAADDAPMHIIVGYAPGGAAQKFEDYWLAIVSLSVDHLMAITAREFPQQLVRSPVHLECDFFLFGHQAGALFC